MPSTCVHDLRVLAHVIVGQLEARTKLDDSLALLQLLVDARRFLSSIDIYIERTGESACSQEAEPIAERPTQTHEAPPTIGDDAGPSLSSALRPGRPKPSPAITVASDYVPRHPDTPTERSK